MRYVKVILFLVALLPSKFNFWFGSGISFASAQQVIAVGPFMDDDILNLCIDSFTAADFDFDERIDSTEFNIAVATWTDDSIPALTSATALPLQAVFNRYSCVLFRFCDETRQVCCEEGAEQYIPLNNDLSDLERKGKFFHLCAATENAILSVTETFPTSTPSSFPSFMPTDGPTKLSSVQPTDIPSLLSSTEPTTVLSDEPSLTPSDAPSDFPSDSPSSTPTTVPSIFLSTPPSLSPSSFPSSTPTDSPTDIPSVFPTLTVSVVPSTVPSDIPSTAPSIYPSNMPSETPSADPTTISSKKPSGLPSLTPTQSPSLLPTDTPSLVPSIFPSLEPTAHSSLFPSASKIPTMFPSNEPSAFPTVSPSLLPSSYPTKIPTYFPSLTPSAVPSISFAPTRFGRLKITLTYGLRTLGVNAEDIRTAKDNSIAEDLLVVVTDIVLDIIGQEEAQPPIQQIMRSLPLPGDEIKEATKYSQTSYNDHIDRMKLMRRSDDTPNESHSQILDVYKLFDHNTRRSLRKLVRYLPEVPAFHSSIIQNVCDPFDAQHECVIIQTVVVVFTDEGEDRKAVRASIVAGFNQAINDGSFFNALVEQ